MPQASPPKAYELAFDQRSTYLLAVVECKEPCLDVKKAFLIEIGEKCVELGVLGVLIERRIPGTLSNIECHLAIEAFADAAPAGLTVAIVDPEEINRKRLAFGVRTAEPRDITIQIFADLIEAESWLTK